MKHDILVMCFFFLGGAGGVANKEDVVFLKIVMQIE